MTTELVRGEKRIRLCDAAETAFLFALGLCVFVLDITKTTLSIELPDSWETWLIAIITASIAIRLAVLFATDRETMWEWRRYFIGALAMDAVYFMVYLQYHYNLVVYLALLTLGSVGIHYRKVLKVYIVAAVSVIFPAILMAWAGAIENFVYIREMTTRSAWGIKYPTDLMSLLFFLILAVWVVFRDCDDLWFLIPGVVLAVMSQIVADSRTGVMCYAAFIIAVMIESYLSRRGSSPLGRFIDICSCIAFPLFTFISIALLYAFRAGIPVAVSLDGKSSGRLTQSLNALNEHGLSLFGRELEQNGWGGSSFARPDYAFVDISYIAILLQFGIVALVMINIIWVLMTRKSIRIGDRRLELVLALIAFNALSEHHVAQTNYDILLAVPFAILAVKQKGVYEPQTKKRVCSTETNTRKEKLITAAIISAIAAVFIAAFLTILPILRTAVSVIGAGDSVNRRRMMFLVCALAVWCTIVAIYSLFRLCRDRILKNDKRCCIFSRKTCLAIIILFCIAFCSAIIACNMIISRGTKEHSELIGSERDALETIQASGSKLYVTDTPSIYRRAGYDVSSSLYNGEEIARFYNTSVLIDKNLDSAVLFGMGFLYMELSDRHALYTNDYDTVKALEGKGYKLKGYYSPVTDVDLAELAKKNKLETNEDGSITLSGVEHAISKGPRDDLRAGRYTFTYSLALDKAREEQGDICNLRITYYKDDYIVEERTINADQFDSNGELREEIICDLPDARNVDIEVTPIGDNNVIVRGISYCKTPAVDIHPFYNSDMIRYREEYYDLEGEPYLEAGGYFAKTMETDSRGNVVREEYYDENGEKVLNKTGFAELRREFNEKNQDIRDTYYGLEGEIVIQSSGQAATGFKYDEMGRQAELTFYDINGDPVAVGGETWGGYYGIKREFDDQGRVIREYYLDENGNAVMAREGCTSKEYIYDDDSNRIAEVYYDNEKRTINVNGYCELRREMNQKNQDIRDIYYGINGERIELPSGRASTRFKYDEKGHAVELSFYDMQDKPTMIDIDGGGGYHKIARTFDERGRVVHEEYYGIDGRPALTKEGFAARDMIYESTTTVVKGYTYYDAEGNEISKK